MPRHRFASRGLLLLTLGVGCEAPVEPGPVDELFVSGAVCAGCHPAESDRWAGSHHDLAMQEASRETVLGDFGGTVFTHLGVSSRFFERNGAFFVETEGPFGEMGEFEIAYTFGVEPLQQYLVEFPGGRLQSLTIAWDTERRRWFSLYPDERITPDDPLHWTGRYQNWNAFCAECHSTHLRKGYDATADRYQTSWVDIDVSCEACHGPGRDHVRWARDRGDPDYEGLGLRVRFSASDPTREVESCAPCHSRRHRVSGEDEHGRPYLDDFMPELLSTDLYHVDGQILEEVYVYGSFLQSRMHQQGVRCSDCHDPHSLEIRAEGNALCVQCHTEQPPARFPTLARRRYDDPAHHFHADGSEGARCVSCHMPSRDYMVIDGRRDHSFRIPRPDLTQKIGTPNACNGCHEDRSPEWAAHAVGEAYGSERRPHWAEVIVAARSGAPGAEAALIALVEDRANPGIVRATGVEQLRLHGPDAVEAIGNATRDPDPLVRATAAGSLDRLPPERRTNAAIPLLDDPVGAVRVEAARVLASTSTSGLEPAERAAFEAALTEFENVQRVDLDQPSAHLNMGVLHTGQGRLEQAEQSYRRAMEMDPEFLPARVNLANLYNSMGRNADAEGVLREAIERSPEEGELHYSLGLLLAEEGRIEEAVDPLGKAAERIPDRGRVRYNYALALQHLGRRDEAERQLLQAHRVDPRDPSILQAIVILYVQDQRFREARTHAQRLLALTPEDPGLPEMIRRIETELEEGS